MKNNHYVMLNLFLFGICLFLSTVNLFAGEIHQAAASGDLDKVKALLKADATLVNARDENGSTPLHMACLRYKVAVANYLLDNGADVNARNKWEQTPLHGANGVFGQDYDLIKRMIEIGADVNAKGDRGDTPLHWAIARGNLKVAKLLIDSGTDLNAYDEAFGTLVHHAIAMNHQDITQLLIESGAKLNQKNRLGHTELHLAAIYGHTELVNQLIKHGAEVHAVDNNNRTPLYFAAKHGYRSVANVLIAAGANENTIVEKNYGKAPQLVAKLKSGESWLWYLGGDGYAVKTQNHLLLFDPPGVDEAPEAGLANGRLNPSELAGQKITVLITKPDWERYSLGIFDLARQIDGVNFVISFKPEAKLDSGKPVPVYQLAEAGKSLSVGKITIHTISATLGGVAYLVEADGLKIYHAGYHATKDSTQIEKFNAGIDLLKIYSPIDMAILPVSGHLIPDFTYGAYLDLLTKLNPNSVYLMHGYYEYDQYEKCTKALSKQVVTIKYPEGVAGGDRFYFSSVQDTDSQTVK